MKTSKRKRSAQAEPVVEAAAADVVAADTPIATDRVAEATLELSEAGELNEAAVQALVAESAAEGSAEVAEAVVEPAVIGDPIVVLNSNCSVKDAAALKTSLLAFAKHSDAVTLDVSAVERVDTATMQLLCAFVRDRGGRNQNITWRGESQALQDAVRLLGVGALLGFETKGVAA